MNDDSRPIRTAAEFGDDDPYDAIDADDGQADDGNR